MRDVFYLSTKPNVHPRERFAESLAHARELCRTDHFWIVNEFCDYTNFDWDFDFEFLPDEEVWSEEHNNVWPSLHQKDSGTWLCPKEVSDIIIYRGDVESLRRKNEVNQCWVIHELVDQRSFDFSWHPDPSAPPYIYTWGNKWVPAELGATIEYLTPGATERQYMDVPVAILSQVDLWQTFDEVKSFDFTWRPDPREPPYIYVWGNKWIPAELQPTIEYTCPGATERKYMETMVDLKPRMECWTETHLVDRDKFDLSWRPDPREPPYIYVWGNKWIAAELQPTIEYTCPGATERKYMEELVDVLQEKDRWNEIQPVDQTSFDLSWRPDPRDPPYIYTWGNIYTPGEREATLEYTCPGAMERKYMGIVDLAPQWSRWKECQLVKLSSFDFRWRPDPNLEEPPYIYVWGNKWISAELQPTIEYHVPGATERKYMDELVSVIPEETKWKEIQPVDRTSFDLTWRPDPREPPYIYVWGNIYTPGEREATLEYHVPGATERKYMSEPVQLAPQWDRWKEIQPVDKKSFDFRWRPDPNLEEPPYIYVWGNKWVAAELQPTLEYHVPGATERKYMSELVEVLPEKDRWKEIQQIDQTSFDLSWRPDPIEPPYIYVWGNKWVTAELQPTLEYHVPGATERKYMEELVVVLPEKDRWVETSLVDWRVFDFTWRPDPREPPYIYTWGNKWVAAELAPTVEYVVPGATERKYMDELAGVLPQTSRWTGIADVVSNSFDFTWRPDPREPPYIYTWGNKWVEAELQPTLEYTCPGATERKYMSELIDVLQEKDRWNEVQDIDDTFDMSWRPDPREPPFIYTWGNKWIGAELLPTIEYTCPGATERKYMEELVVVLPENDRWVKNAIVDQGSFDFTWRPDPREPPYIYVWGNKWISAELQATIEYTCPGATERKYMEELVVVLPEKDRWNEVQPITKQFDQSWRPDPREPPYIYVWGNKWIPAELQATIEYTCPGATERKYMEELVGVRPETEKWVEVQEVDSEIFDMSWRPDPREPPYIYVWGNKWVPAELKATLEYHVPGATERKYMSELVDVLQEKDRWEEFEVINKETFDLSWRPDPREPPYIYVWGNLLVPAEVEPTILYRCSGATEYKYMSELVDLLPDFEKWTGVKDVDKSKFDFTWRPNLNEPPYIYVWGNKWIAAELQPTLEYLEPGATERKYMDTLVEVLPQIDRWNEVQPIDQTSFDLSWRPDPREPPYIYVWGNKWIPAELKATLEYTCPGATERKYMSELVEVLPEKDRWNEVQPIDQTSFDLSWRPDPREPPYIYVWGNTYTPGEREATLEYACPGATERKYMGIVDLAPEWDRWKELQPINKSPFDFRWRPDPNLGEPPYIYVWGNKWIAAELQPTLEYHVPGATERKYMSELVEVLPEKDRWVRMIPIDETSFDFTWRPDPREPPMNYVWGNQHHAAEIEPTIQYRCPGASETKFMPEVAHTLKDDKNWEVLLPVSEFDFTWRPEPGSPPYIYVWGNQWNSALKEPTIKYVVPGATDFKYMDDTAMCSHTLENWETLTECQSFDYSWRPDPTVIPYIYIFGNKWNDGRTEPTVKYTVPGAIDTIYLDAPVATPAPNIENWVMGDRGYMPTFDYSWRPNPHAPAQIYEWLDGGPRYVINGGTDVVYMNKMAEIEIEVQAKIAGRYKIKTTLADLIAQHPGEVFWALNPDLNYDKFDFSWRPAAGKERYISVFGRKYAEKDEGVIGIQTYFVNGPAYELGFKEFTYVDLGTQIEADLSMFWIDRGNAESADRFTLLKEKFPKLQKTRFLNTWVDTINRCTAKSETTLFWVLSSELDYSTFKFDYYPGAWQMKMVHVFGTQWSHWGNTYLVNRDTFAADTKWVKIIEHLSVLNFVKTKRAVATNRLYDIVMIDHGNPYEFDRLPGLTIQYDTSYLNTFRQMLEKLPEGKDHYVWICSSVCDYSKFDFSYICDPFAKDQLHVFPSDKQKFGDTFLIDVNKLRESIGEMTMLEDTKINFNAHQRVERLESPVFRVDDDTMVNVMDTEFNFPYAVFEIEQMDVKDEPMNLWTPETKTITVTSTGGTRIIVPKEAKEYVKRELYDYPHISKSSKLLKSKPMDIVFLSNGELGADENYDHLVRVTKGLPNRVTRVDGITGRVAAYHASARASETPWAFTVFAKLKVNPKFDWSWQPDRLQLPKHYIFHATNPVNGLEYGHQAMIAYNKRLVLANTGHGLDFTLDDEHEVVEENSGVANYNSDPFSTWRTAFRETLKLCASPTPVNNVRLNSWLTKGVGDHAEYSTAGSRHAMEYYDEVVGDLTKLRLSYDWAWLHERFLGIYQNA